MKLLFKRCIATLFLCVSAQIFCMNSQNSYFQQCKQINRQSKKSLTIFLEDACKTNPIQKITDIKVELGQIQESLDKKKKDALLAIKQKYNISNDLWHDIITIQQTLNEFEESHKHIGLANVKHDNALPADIVLMLKKNLKSNGINPERINLKLCNKNCAFERSVPRHDLKIKGNIITVSTKEPGMIAINKPFLDISSHENKEAFCLILATDMKDYAPNIFEIIETLTLIKIDKTDKPLLQELRTTLSIFTLALKNKYNAQLLKKHWSIAYDPEFSIDDYELLSKIDRLHKALAWLKKYAAPETEESIST